MREIYWIKMKTIFGLILVYLVFTLGKPLSKEELDLETLKWSALFEREASALVELIGQVKEEEESDQSTILDKFLNAYHPDPLDMIHPIIIKDEMKETKDIWDSFEWPWAGFGPSSTRRPFTPFDFRIIG